MNYNDARLEHSQSRVRIVWLWVIIMLLVVALLFVVGCKTTALPNVTSVTDGARTTTIVTYPAQKGILDSALDYILGKAFDGWTYIGSKL